MPQWIEMTRSPEYSPKLIGQELVFLQNDFRELLNDLGDVAFMDKIEKAMLGETIIVGGFLRTELIAANSIVSDKISSNAITARHIQAGAITADKIAANSIVGDKISSNAITARHIQAGAITADKIAANSITADKINVASLSAISADLGEVTSGIITGALIRTNAANDRIELGDNVLQVHSGANKSMEIRKEKIRFYDWEGTTRVEPVGMIFSARKVDSPNQPGIVLANEKNAYIALAYRKGDSLPSYADFDIDNVLNNMPQYPIKLWENTYFGNKARVQVALEFGDSPSAGIWESTADFLVIRAGTQGFIFSNHNADEILRYSSSDAKWSFRRNVQIDNNLTVSGSKNSLQKTKNYGERLINAYETAEYYFGDIGFGTINDDGECVVYIDEIFKECINTDIAYHVFTQVYNGKITGIERYKDYFIVYGEPNTRFSWEIKAKRIGYEHYRLEQPTRFEADDLDPYNFDLELIERRETGEDKKLTKMYDDILNLDLSKILLEV